MKMDEKLQVLTTESAIQTVQDFQQNFQSVRNYWEKIVKEIKEVPTPPNVLEEVDKWLVPSYEYMESLMDKYHPRRRVIYHEAYFEPSSFTFHYTVEVMDLITGESRLGASVHPCIAYEAGTQNLKPQKEIRQHMKNAKKAALTEAIRDAYAHFGCAADRYGMKGREQVTEEQRLAFESLIENLPDDVKAALREKWKAYFADSADAFLEKLKSKINKKEKKQ